METTVLFLFSKPINHTLHVLFWVKSNEIFPASRLNVDDVDSAHVVV